MICPECREEWAFRSGESEWYVAQGLKPPRRCKDCRDRRRAARANEQQLDGVVDLVRADYGFLRSADGRRFYFRHTDCREGARLVPGERVRFTVGDRADGPSPRATFIDVEVSA